MPKAKKSRGAANGHDYASLFSQAHSTVARGIAALDRCIRRVEEKLDQDAKLKGEEAKYDQRLASHLAYLLEHATPVLRELRQVEKHQKNRVDEMSDAETFQVLIDAGWRPPKGWSPEGGAT